MLRRPAGVGVLQVANFDPFSNLRGPRNGVFFEPYARLIQILYPRCKAVLFYDGRGAAATANVPFQVR